MANHKSTTPKEHRDLWRTPDWLYNWLDSIYHFDIDLACTSDNCKAHYGMYYDKGIDSLNKGWIGFARTGFCNPPYSNLEPWLAKAVEEARKGFVSVWVIPAPYGSKWNRHLNQATQIGVFDGRIAFVNSKGKEIGSNDRGTAIVTFGGRLSGSASFTILDRNKIKKEWSNG